MVNRTPTSETRISLGLNPAPEAMKTDNRLLLLAPRRLIGWPAPSHSQLPGAPYIPLAFGEKGISDIIACSPVGQFTAIEVKKPGGRPSPDQLAFIESVVKNGASRSSLALLMMRSKGSLETAFIFI